MRKSALSRPLLYTCPDVVAVCGEPRFEDDELDTDLNPTMIVEVLSPTTEAYDRGDKFRQYRELPSLRRYVLIALEQGDWWSGTRDRAIDVLLKDFRSLDSALCIDSDRPARSRCARSTRRSSYLVMKPPGPEIGRG